VPALEVLDGPPGLRPEDAVCPDAQIALQSNHGGPARPEPQHDAAGLRDTWHSDENEGCEQPRDDQLNPDSHTRLRRGR
jgi:hypothetical protein